VNTFIDQSPALESIKMRMAEIDAQIHTARQSRFESFSVGIGMTQEPTQKSMDFSLNIPIAWQNRYENTIAALMSQRSALEHQKNNVHNRIRLGIEALSEHLKEREEMIRKSDEMHKQYEMLFTMAQKGFEGGVITQFEYLATKTEYYDARLRSVDLREEYIDEMYELESRLGGIVQ
jgi:outer membrane protein TolC